MGTERGLETTYRGREGDCEKRKYQRDPEELLLERNIYRPL